MAIESTSSSSRCVAATHNFEVTNYQVLDGMGIGELVSSNTFTVGGCDWRINFYPDGSDAANQGAFVSVFIYFVGGRAGVCATATFSLLRNNNNNNGSHQVMVRRNATERTFKAVGNDWGFAKFFDKSNLQEFRGPNGGGFTIRCVVMIKEEVPHTTEDAAAAAAAAVVVPQPKLQQDLTDMLKSGEGADVTFSVEGKLFPAHRCILAARSMVFKAELFGAMKEKDAQRIEIDDMEPAVFEALLHFVYADSLPDDDDDGCDDGDSNVAMQHLLVAADRYGLDRLRLLCEAKLCCRIDVQTVTTTLGLAEQHHCTQLRGACIGFIASRDVLGAVMETDGFKDLVTSCPGIMMEILDKVAAVWSNK